MDEAISERFTGTCTIVLGSENAALVLKDGQIVLASYGNMKGQHALDAVLEREMNDAAVEQNILTPEQVQLALEFNPPYMIKKPGRSGETPAEKNVPVETPPRRSKGADAPPSSRQRPTPAAEVHHIPMPGVKAAQKTTRTSQSGKDEFNALVQNMEEIDIEQLVGSFKVNCKDILKKIHLDHLIKDKDI
jgi:hypothetical protein